MLECFDKENNVTVPSGSHHRPSYAEDIKLIIGELKRNHIFDRKDNRKRSYCRKTKNLLHAKPTEDVVSWLCTHSHSRYYTN